MIKRSPLYRSSGNDKNDRTVFTRQRSRRSASLSRHQQNEKTHRAGVMTITRLEVLVRDYLNDCATAHSARTVEKRQDYLSRLLKYLRENEHDECTVTELRAYFGNLKNLHTGQPLRAVTLDTMRRDTAAFWNWLIQHKHAESNPVLEVRKPIVRKDQRPALSEEQVRALVNAARQSFFAPRDLAIVLFLLDTGVRSSELCGIQLCDLDMEHKRALVTGKGDKIRGVYFSTRTQSALYGYLEGRLDKDHDTANSTEAVFLAETGSNIGRPLTRRGIYQLIERLIVKAGIKGTKKGAHLLRHTFTYHFFRNGGQQQTAMLLLGHEDPKMTHGYCKLASADLQDSLIKHSPVDKMKL